MLNIRLRSKGVVPRSISETPADRGRIFSIPTVYSYASYNISHSDDVIQDCACSDIIPVPFERTKKTSS